mmetsp:Transcript_2856/g.8641  ORF Transcript_2856/g.8641 Transcript_2856/m.8641 type:complete len:248 (+) Transcript_2856:171-914(+)
MAVPIRENAGEGKAVVLANLVQPHVVERVQLWRISVWHDQQPADDAVHLRIIRETRCELVAHGREVKGHVQRDGLDVFERGEAPQGVHNVVDAVMKQDDHGQVARGPARHGLDIRVHARDLIGPHHIRDAGRRITLQSQLLWRMLGPGCICALVLRRRVGSLAIASEGGLHRLRPGAVRAQGGEGVEGRLRGLGCLCANVGSVRRPSCSASGRASADAAATALGPIRLRGHRTAAEAVQVVPGAAEA